MAAKIWKYEKDCQRTEALVKETVAASQRPGWGHCVLKVLVTLRVTRPKATPLALHFIDVSAKEMLSGRHDTAKLCFLVAQSIADKALMTKMALLFNAAFTGLPPEVAGAIQQAMQGIGGKLSNLPDGLNEIELLPGLKAHVIKQSFGTPPAPQAKKKGKKAVLPEGNRWN